MSKQHQASRRRNYAPRQHQLAGARQHQLAGARQHQLAGARQHQLHERANRGPSAVEMPSGALSYQHQEGRTISPLAVEAGDGWSSPQGI